MEHFTLEEALTIRKIFDQFDRNKNGSIDLSEMQTLCIALNDPLSPAELRDFFKLMDIDLSGEISWDEFINYWGNN